MTTCFNCGEAKVGGDVEVIHAKPSGEDYIYIQSETIFICDDCTRKLRNHAHRQDIITLLVVIAINVPLCSFITSQWNYLTTVENPDAGPFFFVIVSLLLVLVLLTGAYLSIEDMLPKKIQAARERAVIAAKQKAAVGSKDKVEFVTPKDFTAKEQEYAKKKEARKQARNAGRTKFCTRCYKQLPQNTKVGDLCPHCGAYLSYEQDSRN